MRQTRGEMFSVIASHSPAASANAGCFGKQPEIHPIHPRLICLQSLALDPENLVIPCNLIDDKTQHLGGKSTLGKISISMIAIIIALPAVAQDVKNNPDLFLQCADYDNSYRAIRADMDSQKSDARYMNEQKDRLEDRINDHERELKRLDEILKIMRNSDNVWDKREREYNRYTRTFDEYDDFMVGFRNARRSFDRLIDRSDSVYANLKGECFGTWSGNILGTYCGQGNSRTQAFCSRFDR